MSVRLRSFVLSLISRCSYQRAGTVHAVLTIESALAYGLYMYNATTIVATASSFAATLLGDRIAANARVDGSLPMILSMLSWWWNRDLAVAKGEVCDTQFQSMPSHSHVGLAA